MKITGMLKTRIMPLLASILLLAGPNAPAQNTVSLSGTVLEAASGEAVIGASVMVKGTTRGTVTGLDGDFSISVPAGSSIVVSSIGFKDYSFTATQSVQGMKILLEMSAEFLDEIVVVGYGSVKKENLTGAVDQVSAEVFAGRPVANATQMLQGVVPNLNIELVDGKPGRSADYNIRGTTSIGAGGSALILIDGVEGDPSALNPNDIESVSVLKDAASAAVYGSRAPYGVVLITTKNPDVTSGKAKINYSGSFSVMDPTAVPDVVTDGFVYASLFSEGYYNVSGKYHTTINKSQPFSRAWLEDFRQRQLAGIKRTTEVGPDGKYVYYANTDWYDWLYKDYTTAQTHNVSVSGGNKDISYYVSGRFYQYDGLFNLSPDKYYTMNLRAKMSANLRPWLKLSENISLNNEFYHIPSTSNQQSSGNFWSAINSEGHPSAPIFNPDGTMTKSGAYAVGGLVTGNNYKNRKVKNWKSTTALKASFFDDTFRINADFSYADRGKNELQKRTVVPYSEAPGEISYLGTPGTDDYLQEYFSETDYVAANVYAEYEKLFAGKHYFKAMGGYNYEREHWKGVYAKRYDLLSYDTDAINLAVGEDMEISSNESRWRVSGFMFRLNYNYDERYLFEVNGRYDGSSKFPNYSQWGFFPSASAAWRVSQEHWWKLSPKIISNLKIRGSFGELGNGSVGTYAFMEKFSYDNMGKGTGDWCRTLDGVSGLRYTSEPSQIPDNLTWETSQTLDAGLDLGMFSGRMEFVFDWYKRRTYNMYTTGPTLPDTYGASAPKGNYADMYTRGWEVTLSWHDNLDFAGSPFSYGFKATLADSRSFITKYYNPTWDFGDYYAGYEIGDVWGWRVEGLFRDQDQINTYWTDIETGLPIPYEQTRIRMHDDGITKPGDVIFSDLNHNNMIDSGSNTLDDPGDQTIIGNTHPRLPYSLNLDLSWRGIYINAFIQGVGKRLWSPTKEGPFWGQYCRPYAMAYKWQLDNCWTPENPDALLPKWTGYCGVSWQNKRIDRYMMDVSYCRLKNLQLGYNFPKKLLDKLGMSQMSIYFSAENLWTWSPMHKYTKDFDVVTVCYGSDSDLGGGEGDGYNYPTMRTFSFGLQIGF
ncbi:MAG: TonB-dependent receptor [Bacteroidales bacterium]|nr:TonB-dependent receptor [Bacteroidales bacterium]